MTLEARIQFHARWLGIAYRAIWALGLAMLLPCVVVQIAVIIERNW